jgi:hypothetical protein
MLSARFGLPVTTGRPNRVTGTCDDVPAAPG